MKVYVVTPYDRVLFNSIVKARVWAVKEMIEGDCEYADIWTVKQWDDDDGYWEEFIEKDNLVAYCKRHHISLNKIKKRR